MSAIEAVVQAWVNQGPVPGYHRHMQSKLRKEWPVLAKALEALVVEEWEGIIRQAKAEALREAAAEIRDLYFGPDQVIPFSAGSNHKWGSDQAAKTLEARASRIEAGG